MGGFVLKFFSLTILGAGLLASHAVGCEPGDWSISQAAGTEPLALLGGEEVVRTFSVTLSAPAMVQDGSEMTLAACGSALGHPRNVGGITVELQALAPLDATATQTDNAAFTQVCMNLQPSHCDANAPCSVSLSLRARHSSGTFDALQLDLVVTVLADQGGEPDGDPPRGATLRIVQEPS